MSYPTTKMDRTMDRLIAEVNNDFLNDPQVIAEAERQGEIMRERMEALGILPPLKEKI